MELFQKMQRLGIPEIHISKEEWKQYANVYEVIGLNNTEDEKRFAAEAIIKIYLFREAEQGRNIAQRLAEAERFAKSIVDKCEYCDEGFLEYQPSGIDGYLPTGDANFVTEPCWFCSEARAFLAAKK